VTKRWRKYVGSSQATIPGMGGSAKKGLGRASAAFAVLLLGALGCAGSGEEQSPPLAQLAFTTQPPAVVEGNAMIAPAISVALLDAQGKAVPTGAVTLSLASSPRPEASLHGTTTLDAVNGFATFPDLRISTPGAGYTLAATSGGVSATSAPLAVALTFYGAVVAGTGAVSAGTDFTCAIAAGGTYCWGGDAWGQLGNGPAGPSLVPSLVEGGEGLVAVSAGAYHACALRADGKAWCWGMNGFGQLGDGTTTDRDAPVAVDGGLAFAAVSAGTYHTCGLTSGGVVHCWGWNVAGQLGDGTQADRSAPGPGLGAPGGFVEVSAGGAHTCGRTAGRAIWCWGDNGEGQLGDGTKASSVWPTPVSVPMPDTRDLVRFNAVSAGQAHTCALTSTNEALCWGSNAYGQLGDGTTTSRAAPVAVVGGPSAWLQVSAGRAHTCGRTVGAVYCWGANGSGQLGDGSTAGRVTPTRLSTQANFFEALSAGNGHTCALAPGPLSCWGLNSAGQLGDGTTVSRTAPAPVVQ